MTPSLRVCLVALALAALSVGCPNRGGDRSRVIMPVRITVDNNTKNCIQTVNDGYAVPPVDRQTLYVYADHNGGKVKWVFPAGTSECRVAFKDMKGYCPFYGNSCAKSCKAGENFVTSDAATGPKDYYLVYLYDSISVDHALCNINGNGIVLDH